ncbi:MAG TPA: hypothetical protein VHN14_07415 [Kofleriaceae bacterium]|jgi:hypothetical protein|nr:hypothetical protein [Kofleriaceae bacterium]
MRCVAIPWGLVAGLAGCTGLTNDPVYIPGPMTMEAGVADMTGMLSEAKASLQLPIKTETADDMKKRAALATTLAPVMVPYVKVGDIEIDVEWTIKNLDMKPGQAKIELNGANEFFSYDPSIIVLEPGNDEAPPTPGLGGDIPIDVPAGGEVSGLFTEDQLREAAIDLDEISRGNFNPFRAELTISKNAQMFQPMTPLMPGVDNYMQTPTGPAIPREAFAELIRVDLVFRPNTHMVLEYNVRVRDLRGIMHDLLLTAVTEKPGELQMFNPMVFNVSASTTPTP